MHALASAALGRDGVRDIGPQQMVIEPAERDKGQVGDVRSQFQSIRQRHYSVQANPERKPFVVLGYPDDRIGNRRYAIGKDVGDLAAAQGLLVLAIVVEAEEAADIGALAAKQPASKVP